MENDTLCFAYNYLGTIAMETFLFHDEYNEYTEDADGDHTIDDFLYYQLFNCHLT